ncbi:MAG: LCP family protein [Lachnospiraceae bacterium]|nr:LCP family protein [uncultured Acetatifactor sp.]MCI8287960.1 LCP family protein [Lachnospiraceae bacterium]
MNIKKRKENQIWHIIVKIMLGMVVLVFLGAVAFLALQISGKNRLYSNADNTEMLAALSGMATEMGGEQEEGGDWQYGDIRHKGIHYRYNEDILTFLFLGIDRMSEVKEVESTSDGGQSDAIFLLVLNPHNKEMTVIGIPRDTMTEVEMYDVNGAYWGTEKAQLAIQHGYGDGAQLSCERSVKAVSKLFYNLPINGYCAINMGAIPLINDVVGGIELQAVETMDFKDFQIKEGERILLKGMDAYYYLHNRDTTSFNSAGRRLERQKQYLTAYAGAAMEKLKEDITFPVSLYNTLSKYMVTDITVDEISYLAMQAAGYGFPGENFRSLKGATVQGEVYEEFYPDEEVLYELILEVFYEEVEQNAG